MSAKANILCAILTREPSLRDEVKDSLLRSMREAESFGIRTEYLRCIESYGVVIGRNRVVSTFMAGDWTHLLFVDDDVAIPKQTIAVLEECKADIAAGCYVFLHPDGNRVMPSLTARVDGRWLDSWFDGVREVQAAGTGCMLIRREVFEALGFPWFQWPMWLNEDGHFECNSDDFDFCVRARAKGFSVVAHGDIRCSHLKTIDIAHVMPGRFRVPQSHYASHAPALEAIAEAFPIRKVLEFGAGLHSTPTFLNRDVFPEVESVVSHEQRDEWIERLRSDDPRLSLRRTPIASMPYMIEPADLAFIDCDAHAGEEQDDYDVRVKLIDACRGCGIVVVHDAQEAALAQAVESSGYSYRALWRVPGKPYTAILSNTHDVSVLVEPVEVA